VTFGTIFTNPEMLTPLIRELTAKGHGVRVALAAGIPLVLIPQGADQGGQAECVARTGAAITIAAEAFSPRAVALAVADVLEQPSYRATARRIAHRIATMPSADDMAALLARAAHRGSP
jgi:UDP:flavonoid glycosyltransferase YjiC (YdhE family)